MSIDLSELFSGLIGSVVGGLFALAGTWWGGGIQRRQTRKAAEEAERQLITGCLGAIEAELRVNFERYSLRLRPALAEVPDGGFFNLVWPISHDYFTVYQANAPYIGRIQDAELRTLIVRTYTLTKGMLDSLQMNSEMARRLEQYQVDPNLTQEERGAKSQAIYGGLVEYATALKTSDAELVSHYERTFALIDTLKGRLAKQASSAAS